MSKELVQQDVIDGEVVDNECEHCGGPGELVVDPAAKEVNGEIVHVVLCEEGYRRRCEDA